jgi:hypothetical protein
MSDGMPRWRYGRPILFIGLSKTGTQSIHHMMQCNRVRDFHYTLPNPSHGTVQQNGTRESLIGVAMRRCHRERRPVLSCVLERGFFSSISQMDAFYMPGHSWIFPQIEYLEEMVGAYPNATYVLNRREPDRWATSVQSWWRNGSMGKLFAHSSLQFGRVNPAYVMRDGSHAELVRFYETHIAHVRAVFSKHGYPRLLEVVIDSQEAAHDLAHLILQGGKKACWQRVSELSSHQRREAASKERALETK